MKKMLQRISVLCVCIVMLMGCFLTPVAYAASDVYELAFDNLFIFEQWANHPNLSVLSGGGTLTTDISNGSFVLTNNSTSEVFTSFSMSSVGSFYSMPVEENTEYTFSYIANGTTTSFEVFVFYFDKNGQYTSNEAKHAYQYGKNEWNFTTPAGTGYIQVRFDNNSPSSNVTVSDIRICAKETYNNVKNSTYRKVFTYSTGTTYGALPVPARDGLVFAGWYTGPNGAGEKITSSTTMVASSLSLYSKWDPSVEGDLTVVALPIRQSYCVGEAINTRGLVINVAYPDGTSENIDEGFSCSPTAFTSAGNKEVTVTYGGKTTSFTVNVKESESKSLLINGAQKTATFTNNIYTLNYSGAAFNRYVIKYSSNAYVKGEFSFNGTTEEFFLEPSENGEFSGYIDGFIDGTTRTAITSVSFEPLDKDFMDFTLTSIDLSKASSLGDSSGMVYLSDNNYKIGIDLDWGGALTYLEDLTNSVVSAKSNENTSLPTQVGFSSDYEGTFYSGGFNIGSTNIGGTKKDKYEKQGNVNLINAHDTGRLVQQSYYGTGSYPYEPGMYGEAVWNYNPVQGGNLYNQASKIVDLQVTSNQIYIKCRPLDWAKDKQYITPSYMEAWYTLEDGMMRATCRFVDYSGYPSVTTTQEFPAFYCVEPLNDFVYYTGGEAWSDSNTKVNRADLGFWGTATDQTFICNENWAAFKGDADNSFAIGLYCPGQTNFYSGVYYGGNNTTRCSTLTPATEDPTSYIGVVDTLHFQSYTPISYCYYISTGKVEDIRNDFKAVAQTQTDICNATATNGFCDMCGKYTEPELSENKYDVNNDGANDSVYEISNAGELYWFRDFVNSGNTSANAVLVADIKLNTDVLTGYGIVNSDTSAFSAWTPIGTSSYKYNGIFDGRGHTINGLYTSDSSLSYVGLFGYTGTSAVIKRVGVDDSYFRGKQYVGGIAGYNTGKIENCYAFYIIAKGSSYVGGIAGYSSGTIQICYNSGVINGTNYVGALAGGKSSSAKINNSYYLEGCATDGAGAVQYGVGASSQGATVADSNYKTVEQFASGEVASQLQDSNTEQLWGQRATVSGFGPVFDTTGQYKVLSSEGSYSLASIGDVNEDDVIDEVDYQQQINAVLSGKEQEYSDMLHLDIDGDGYLDVIDCSLMQLMVTGLLDKMDVYLKGDFDFDGVAFTDEDKLAIKKALINTDKLTTRQKYACDLNFDGVLNVDDKDILLQQKETSKKHQTGGSLDTRTANVIIIAGQSNAYGASPLTDVVRATASTADYSNIKIKYNNINSYDGVNWQTMFSNNSFETFKVGIGGQADAWFGPELGVAYHLATTESTKDEVWYIIKYTAAGTFLGGDWLYDTTGKYSNENNHLNIKNSLGGYLADNMVSYVNNALEEIESMHSAGKVNIRTFMWHQGESDSGFEVWANQYGDLQNTLVNKVRTSFEGRDADNHIGFVDGGIAAYDSTTYYNALTNATQTRNTWVYSDTVNTKKTSNASLWYVPANTSKNIINKTTAGLYENTNASSTKLANSIWVDTSTCLSKLVNNNENGEYDGAHYCGDSMFKIGIWYAQGMLIVSNYS